MNNGSEKRHRHFDSGHLRGNSRGFLDYKKALKEIELKKGDILLDAGCGVGRFSIPASEIVGDSGKVYAFDISEESIKILKEEIEKRGIKNIEAFTGDMTKKLPLKDESIDICLMANVLHGLIANEEVESTLREMFRVLRPDGVLAVIDFKKIDSPMGPPKSIRITPEEAEGIISKYGFKKKRVADVGEYHYAITFLKRIEQGR